MREAVAAFSAAPLENLATGGTCHPGAETMFAAALAFFGLKSSFWHCQYSNISHTETRTSNL